LPGRAAGSPWQVLQRVDHPDPAAANAEALNDLAGGATGLALVFADRSAAGYGLEGVDRRRLLARSMMFIVDPGIAVELDSRDRPQSRQ